MADDNTAAVLVGSAKVQQDTLSALASGAGEAAAGAHEAAAQVSNKALLLAIAAGAANPIDQAPWTYPTAWAASTTVATGAVVVTSARRIYIALVSGTTGSAEPTYEYPVTGPADGTVYWSYIGSISITSSDALAPVTTTGGLSTLAGYGNSYYPALQPGHFTLLDAAGLSTTFGSVQPYGWDNGAGGTTAVSGALGFETEAPAFAISYPYSAPTPTFRVMIDGRWNTIGPENALATQTGANNFNYTLFTFPGRGKARRIIIDCSPIGVSASAIYGVHVPTSTQIRPISINASLAVISDSWGAGAGYAKIIGNRWPQQLGRLLGFDQTYNYSIGGTGYINKGPGPNNTFGERIKLLLAWLKANGKQMPNAWVLAGTINDSGSSGIGAALTAAVQNIRAESKSPIIIFGVQPTSGDATAIYTLSTTANSTTVAITSSIYRTIELGDTISSSNIFPAGTTVIGYGTYSASTGTGTIIVSTPPNTAVTGQTGYSNAGAKHLANEAEQQAAVTNLNDPLVFYVPIYGDENGPWISGTWNNGLRPTFINSAALLGNDASHSYDYGYTYWARKMATKIRRNVYPAL